MLWLVCNPTFAAKFQLTMRALLFALSMMISFSIVAQKKVTLSGYVKDLETGEGMIAATVLVKELTLGTTTNEYGFYSLSLEPGTYTIEWSFIGFETVSETIDLTEDMTRSVEIGFSETTLQEFEVTAERRDENISSVEMSVEKLDIQVVKKIPQLLGEADIIRTIQLLPGVSSVGEGATGFNVRGGNIDQNLILLDESPIFSSSHLFGFFSVFNADAIKDVKLYKGGIPAKYGGRLSSVLDIRQKEGNAKRLGVSGGIGLLFSRLTVEAPIVKDKVSFMVSGRRSYFDLFFPLANNETIQDSKLYFYDLNGKINWTINDNNRVFISAYTGRDIFDLAGEFATQWGNQTLTTRWNHLFSEKLFSNFTGLYSDYRYKLGVPEGTFAFDWEARIENYAFKADFSYFPNPNNTVEFGWQTTYYKFSPGRVRSLEGNEFDFNLAVPTIPAVETAVYLSNEQKVGPRITLSYGLRYSAFAQIGEGTVYEYANDEPVNSEDPDLDVNPIDSTTFGAGDIVKAYHGPEPRFSVNYKINEVSSVKASYNRMRQYIHLISNTTAATPVDIYMPSGEYIPAAIADQVAAGYFRNFADNEYESSVEIYYKWMNNIVDFKDNAELLLNETLETELLIGQGRAYGAEFQIKRQRGKFTGWVSYTLSRVERQVDLINSGEYYPANWDKTHDISIVASYDINEKWNVSSNFAYMTGRPFTPPDARFEFGEVVTPVYSTRNSGRTPAYHRLDLSATYTKKIKRKWLYYTPFFPFKYIWRETPESLEKESGEISWAFGAYNAYARKNPYSIFFQQDEDDPTITNAYRLSIYATIIPYVTLNFKF